MTDASPRIRAATAADLDSLVDFACAMAFETERKRLDAATVRRGIARALDAPQRARYLVAELGGQAVGTLMLTLEWSDWRCADWWWIQSVYVAPAARRLGVFRALYGAVYREAAAAGEAVCGIRLYVEMDNARAQATYAALGMADARYRVMEVAMPWVAQVIGKGD